MGSDIFMVSEEACEGTIMLKCKAKLFLCILIVLTGGMATHTFANTNGSRNINVMNYGAKGDGVTDDTEAIKAAMKAASIKASKPSPVGSNFQIGPTLVFPCGEYVISDEIPVTTLEICGEGRAAIRQINKDKDIFVSRTVWRLLISKLTFLGGKNQVNLYNPNIDTGQIVIDRCRFYGAAGFGIYTDVLSTTVKIEDCEFISCHQSWYNNRCDQALMRDCWIMTDKKMENMATIEHRGMRLTIENLVGVPLVGGARQRWIDNYGSSLTLKQCRFGGEGGGFTPVYNFANYLKPDDKTFFSPMGTNIIVDDCFISSNGSYSANCVIYCYEVPNSISIAKSVLCGSAAVVIDKRIDLANYFKNISPELLSYSIEKCIGERIGKMPEGLLKPLVIKVESKKIILSEEQTNKALNKAMGEFQQRKNQSTSAAVWGGHRQQTQSGKYIEFTDWSVSDDMDATSQKNADWLALRKAGDDMLILFKQSQPGGWPHVTIRGQVDLDKFPWLTWIQKETAAPGSFAMKVIDVESGNMITLYTEKLVIKNDETNPVYTGTHSELYGYHADNLKSRLGVGGTRKLEIRWYPLGWGMKSAKEEDWFYVQPGQYLAIDFLRAEAD
ncbi:MAG: hypothetical protein A2Y12_05415 [Planctomycetes bacterium GWF2_42_9]|nr:MAG: hypothetical protein A2Y12_05415 [Planctomycetes bacterium GWF2_42_9]